MWNSEDRNVSPVSVLRSNETQKGSSSGGDLGQSTAKKRLPPHSGNHRIGRNEEALMDRWRRSRCSSKGGVAETESYRSEEYCTVQDISCVLNDEF